MPILYAFVGRPSIPLCECVKPGVSGNLSQVTSVLSKKLPLHDGQVSFLYDEWTFHCLTSHSLQFVCLTNRQFNRAVACQFLADARARFLACYLPSLSSSSPSPISSSSSSSAASPPVHFPSSFSIPLSLQSDFEGELARLQARYSTDDPRMQRMRDDLADTTHSMMQNLDSVMQRGEQLQALEVKSSALDQQALRFKQSSWQLQRQLWWSNARLSLATAAAACGGLYLLLSMACGGLSLPSC